MTKKIHGDANSYKSIDSTSSEESNHTSKFPDEFLNSQIPSGLPPHELTLKVGIQIILWRSIVPKAGLYNGTRLQIDSHQQFVITVTILTAKQYSLQIVLASK
jgi:ATP-dependent DNA helicase PIF1